jgi:cellulose synthase/poly-beta-1,6-N-acetylglucosamine synthase-like glycosyltransferase
MPEILAWSILALTALVLALLLPFASHRGYLLWVAMRGDAGTSGAADGIGASPDNRGRMDAASLPRVTVQLPVYNEPHVIERVVDAACRLEWPSERFEVQILDDSDDGRTTARAAARARYWRERGVRVEHLRRPDRSGFKAGALSYGAERAEGELFLILDADFVPPPDLVHRLAGDFEDPSVGMVQARWDHLNERENRLTRAQALLLDGHFFFEQGGRFRNGCFFNFNGTAGMWRRRCLEDAGGWESDTLTEDLDLSYRAQMRGWRFVFHEEIGVPAELPARVGPFELQQRRWAQGGVQTAKKLLPALLRGGWPLRVKREAVIHLLGHLAHPLTLLLGLLIYPSAVARAALGLERLLFLDLVIFGAATVPFLVFYSCAGRKRARPWRELLPSVLVTLAVGIGLSASVSRGVLRGAVGAPDPFLRTPKRGAAGAVGTAWLGASRRGDTVLKLTLGAVISSFFVAALLQGFHTSLPFLALFAAGYLGMGIGGLTGAGEHAAGVPQEKGEEGKPDHEADGRRLRPDPRLVVGGRSPVSGEYEPA